MAPAVGLGHAATALSLLALGLNVETRFRAGELPTAPLSEPEPELTLTPMPRDFMHDGRRRRSH